MTNSQPTVQCSPHEAEAQAEAFTGRQVFTVCDLHFASALLAVGVPLVEPARMIEYGGGLRRPLFTFHPRDPDGLVDLHKCAWAAKDPIKYIAENPLNPLSFALAALWMLADVSRKAEEAKAIVPMRATSGAGPVMLFTKDSRLHRAAIKRGMVPVVIENKPTPMQTLCHLNP